MATKLTVGFQIMNNEDMATYHTDVEMSNISFARFERPFKDARQDRLDDIGPIGKTIVKGVLEVPGAIEVFLHPYQITIEKAPLFKWVDISAAVIETIKKAVGAEEVQVVRFVGNYQQLARTLNEFLSGLEQRRGWRDSMFAREEQTAADASEDYPSPDVDEEDDEIVGENQSTQDEGDADATHL